MGAKENILSRIQKCGQETIELPDLSIMQNKPGEINIDVLSQIVETVGGELHLLKSINEVEAKAGQLFPKLKNIYCNIEGIEFGNIKITESTSVSELANLELAILKGYFIVEENAAVWITDAEMGSESIITISENLILVVNKENIVKNMHQAYKKVELKNCAYGVFVSGPSKTADIEQTLVFGAHGAKKLAIFMV